MAWFSFFCVDFLVYAVASAFKNFIKDAGAGVVINEKKVRMQFAVFLVGVRIWRR